MIDKVKHRAIKMGFCCLHQPLLKDLTGSLYALPEFILLSDILGLSTLVDGLSNPKPPGCTESTVLGPFHTEDAPHTEQGGNIASSAGGRKMVVEGVVKDRKGAVIPGRYLRYDDGTQ